jgi:hypothetical protein
MSVIILTGLQVISMFITKDKKLGNRAFLGIPFEFFNFVGL